MACLGDRLVLNRIICNPAASQSLLRHDSDLVLGVSLSSRGGRSEPAAPGSCVQCRGACWKGTGRPGPENRRERGSRRPPSPRRAPAPVQPRPRCQSPLVLTGSRQRGPGAGLMQSARYLGRRLHYQPGPRPERQNQPARARRPPRASSAPPAAPERHAAEPSPNPRPTAAGGEAGPGQAGHQAPTIPSLPNT